VVAGDVAAFHPPKMTIRPRVASYAIDWPERIGGAAAGKSCVHWAPSHSHVSLDSPRSFGWTWSPPNRIVLPRCVSKASDSQNRVCGATVTGICVQLAPSHSHVSPRRPFESCPPNSTARPRAGWKAIAGPSRCVGELADFICVQVLPSYVHVSPSRPFGPSPPNSTTRLRAES